MVSTVVLGILVGVSVRARVSVLALVEAMVGIIVVGVLCLESWLH